MMVMVILYILGMHLTRSIASFFDPLESLTYISKYCEFELDADFSDIFYNFLFQEFPFPIEMDAPIATLMPTTPITHTATDYGEPPSSKTQPNKRRRKKPIVWEYFTVETVEAGCTRACCKQCKKSVAYITGSKLAGTSHLKRHNTMGLVETKPTEVSNSFQDGF
ncbi:hypothetical protein QYF36_014082 [Acer negundo]|nr:hypothetical protein QYF36_014082 [Acer negundo]